MRQARINGAALILLLMAGAVGGGIAIHASPTCQHFIRTYVTVPVRNRVSKTTAEAWAKWRVGHPNWKPNPQVQRPKYVMSRKEALDKVEFACEVPVVPATMDILFPPIDLGDLPPLVALTPVVGLPPGIGLPPGFELPPTENTDVIYPGLIPPEVAEVPPFEGPGMPAGGGGTPSFFIPPGVLPPPYSGGTTTAATTSVPPVVPPGAPVVAGVPEPANFWLVALGIAAPWALYGLRLRSSKRRRDR
jgi:hypothetical protein